MDLPPPPTTAFPESRHRAWSATANALAVAALAGSMALAGSCVGSSTATRNEGRRLDQELRARTMERRADAYLDLSKAYSNLLMIGSFGTAGDSTPDLTRQGAGLSAWKALRNFNDAVAGVLLVGSDRASVMATEATKAAGDYVTEFNAALERLAPSPPPRDRGEVEAKLGPFKKALEPLAIKYAEFLAILRYELRSLGGLPATDKEIPGLPPDYRFPSTFPTTTPTAVTPSTR